ncbi:hypothetical protein HYALB_00007574 [Hymenoscyphus albidus]|uniref:Uncharacterized protein n=1 Tax=Hymenoscyphus albidus TaxID=595503 RepID=A0A9N9Q368_9HELO|nr:hypothetical protein HYALB_00007574 [Hymenoscyphus albidus]
MSDYEGLEYLQPGFDLTTLTVPRLRSILVSHDVNYPSAAKKGQLIQIFNEDLLPQSKRILAVRARARRTSMGIINATDSQETTTGSESTEETDEQEKVPLPVLRTSRRQSSARPRSEDIEREYPSRVTRSRSPTKRVPRPSTKHARASDNENSTDAELQRTARKSRRSATPGAASAAPSRKIKSEYSDEETGDSRRRESAFTYDNPFQSGSSPLSDSKPSGDRRRTVGISSTSRKITPANRRRTAGPKIDDGIYPPKAAVFTPPVTDYDDGLVDIDDNGVEASEEFTPEEQLEIEQEQSAKGVHALGPRRTRRPEGGFNLTGPIWVILITLLGGYAMWYRQEKVAVGYCGVGRNAIKRFPDGVEVPDWLQVLVEPECEPCPQHAYCSGHLHTDCEADFVLKSHPLSLGGIVPLPPTCEPDGDKVRRVKAVADRAVEELRERKAKYECGGLINEAGLPEPTIGIGAEELKKEVSKKRRKGMAAEEFEELWIGAIGEIEGRDEVISVSDGNGKILSTTSLARLPITCAFKRSFRNALARYRIQIGSLIFLASVILYIRQYLRSRAAVNSTVPKLVSLTLERLASQASLHAQDSDAFPENWISIGQLRDDVLRDQHSLAKREAVWTKVRKVVEMNSNVRSSQRESRSGEISRVWEWIGAVSGPASGERRKSGRASYGAYDTADESSDVPASKWQEGRPIY